MKIGLIGTGAIAEAVITGMLDKNAFDGNVLVSKRSAVRSSRLAEKFSNVSIESDNQKIVDQSDWVFVSVLPGQAESLLSSLKFRPDQTLISMIAGRTVKSLRELAHPATEVFRIIPMPPIELGMGPIVITPPSKSIAELFNRFGTAIEVDNEDQFSTFSAVSGMMATFFEFVATQARWVEAQGVPAVAAADYASSLTRALAEMTAKVSPEQLQLLSEECLTAGGLNEQVLRESQQADWFAQIEQRLDRIALRLDEAKKKSL